MNCTALVPSLLLGSLLLTPLATQRAGAGRPKESQQGQSRSSQTVRPRPNTQQAEWTELSEYAEERSRAAFRACDRNADDRLSIFEAGRALRSFGDPQDPDDFRRVDRDTDGYLEWPEFDGRFREIIQAGGSLHLRPYRPVMLAKRAPTANSAAPSKANRLHDFLDRDNDGKVTPTEFGKFVAALGVIGAKLDKRLADLDADNSGSLEPSELAGFAEQVPERMLGPPPTGDPKSRLPRGYRAADRNRDGVLDAAELRRALQRIDPVLGRWTEVILRNADISKNGALGRLEIETAERQGASVPEAKRRASGTKK